MSKRYYRRNPLSAGGKGLLIGGGVLAVIGTVLYVATKPAAASTTAQPAAGSGAWGGVTTQGPLTYPSQITQGHRYQLVLTAPAAQIGTTETVAMAQSDADNFFGPGQVKVISVSTATLTGGRMQGTIVADWLGATQAAPTLPATTGATLTQASATMVVTDMGVSP